MFTFDTCNAVISYVTAGALNVTSYSVIHRGQHSSKMMKPPQSYHCKWRNVYLTSVRLSSQSRYRSLDRSLTCFNVIGY